MTIFLHEFDLPDGVDLGDTVAVDTETAGLSLVRDRLCVVQLSAGNGDAHLVHFPEPRYDAPNLSRLLSDRAVLKLFHFARFDIAVLKANLDTVCAPVYCTKIASRLVRTYTDRHSLKDLVLELAGVELTKEQQSSDWAAPDLTEAQQAYAAADVLYLHELKRRLDALLDREHRTALAQACFDFLPTRAALDLSGWDSLDIFAH